MRLAPSRPLVLSFPTLIDLGLRACAGKDVGACLEMDVCGVKAIPPFGDDSTPSTEGSGSGMTVVAVLLVAGVAAAIFKSKSQGGKMTSTSGESMYADDSDLNFKLDSPA